MSTKDSFFKKAATCFAVLISFAVMVASCLFINACANTDGDTQNGQSEYYSDYSFSSDEETSSQVYESSVEQTSGSEKQFNQPSNGGYFQGHDD